MGKSMDHGQQDEALERLNRGIEDSRRTAQRQTMEVAQEYFGDSVEPLKQQMRESRSRLESLLDEIPGGQDEFFQALFGELMESYSKLENCLDEAEKGVSGMDLERLRRRGEYSDEARSQEVEDTDAAHREARKRGLDLDEVYGTGDGGRAVAEDVRSDEERQTSQPEATDAAHREAEERGIDLSEVEATGVEGQIIISDVVEFAESTAESSGSDSAISESAISESAMDLTDYEPVNSMREGEVPDLQGQLPNGRPSEPADGAQGELESPTGQAAKENGNGGEPKATDAARRKAAALGVSLSDVNGTGSSGQITVADVTGYSEDDRGAVGQAPRQTSAIPESSTSKTANGERDKAQEAARQTDIPGEPLATNAARSRAEKLGVDLSRIKGSGVNGLITTQDVLGARSRG